MSPNTEEPRFETLDESIAHSRRKDFWFNVSLRIVGFGTFLGVVAKLIFGREFKFNDPIIGPLLSPLAFLYLVAFMHVFYTMVKLRLSKPTKYLCLFFFVVAVAILARVLIVDALF